MRRDFDGVLVSQSVEIVLQASWSKSRTGPNTIFVICNWTKDLATEQDLREAAL